MSLGRKDFSVPRTDGSADVFGLAGFLRDDDLIGHIGSFRRIDSGEREHIANEMVPGKLFGPRAYESRETGSIKRLIDRPAASVAGFASKLRSIAMVVAPPPWVGRTGGAD